MRAAPRLPPGAGTAAAVVLAIRRPRVLLALASAVSVGTYLLLSRRRGGLKGRFSGYVWNSQ